MPEPVLSDRSAAWQRDFLRAMGKRIRLVRVDRELSQEQLARAAGMSRNFVSSVERGAHGVDVVRLACLARALGIEIAALLPEVNLLGAIPPLFRPTMGYEMTGSTDD
jgi:transcriptional regulator with XRE-family HTH domain